VTRIERKPGWFPEEIELKLARVRYDWIESPPEASREDQAIFATIFGPFAVGKTTLAMTIADGYYTQGIPCCVLDEAFSESPHLIPLSFKKKQLADHPHDRELREEVQWLAKASEGFFLTEKEKQAERIKILLRNVPPGAVICLAADSHVDPVYALGFGVQEVMAEQDLNEYLDQFQLIQRSLPRPDKIFALTVSPENLILRKERRLRENETRGFEKGVPDSEVAILATISNRVVEELIVKGWPVEVIDTDEIDYAYRPDDRAAISSLIQAQIRQIALERRIPAFGEINGEINLW